jgi:UDP-N-acetylmuramoylalanine--D-glutamate ligase
MIDSLRDKRITVMGLGTRGGGVGVARFLAERGAIVTVTDGKPEADLAEPMSELADLPIRYTLGGHQERDFTSEGADIVIRNPGVRRTSPWLARARESGVAIEMEMSLFLRLCPAPIIGITGTKGKTTTSILCGQMLTAWDTRTVVAGNMGISALKFLDTITADTPVVLEISNWQLEAMDEHRRSPHIAVLTNISEDHLNTYNGFADYAATKRSIARHQRPTDILIVNADDSEAWQATEHTSAQVFPFGSGDRGTIGSWLVDDTLVIRDADREDRISLPDNLRFRGTHHLANVAAAAAAAWTRGAPIEAISRGMATFTGVKDRDELVAEINGVTYINDTAATTPIATIAALDAYKHRRIRLIVGGSDKQVELTPLAEAVADHAAAIYLLDGGVTGRLKNLIEARGRPCAGPFNTMSAVVAAAANDARPGDLVLMSPGCASFDLFRDEFDRGEQFRQSVKALAASTPQVSTS